MKLIVTEKPSTARVIADVLGAKQRKDGYFQGDTWLISWCYGHLVELAQADAYGEQYKKWSLGALPILPDVWKYKVSKDKKKQFDILKSLMNRSDVDVIINACDSGREGELIFRLVYEQTKCKKPTQRLWLSSLEESAIRKGFSELRPAADYDNLYQAALCRAKADYAVGINATRLFSCLYGTTLNVGRVQSPTLALIVNREEAINCFVSEPYFIPQISYADYKGDFVASGERIKDQAEAEAIRAAAHGQEAVITSVEKQQKTIAPPKLYDLTTLQRESNRLLGFTAQQTLDFAQALYEKRLITYPRSDSRFLASDMEAGLSALVRVMAVKLPFVSGATPAINTSLVINNSLVSDHHAIISTAAITVADLSSLPSGERDILLMVATRLLCAVGEKHSYEEVKVVFECGGYSFTTKGKTIIEDGWKAIDNAFRDSLKGKPGDNDGKDNGEDNIAALPQLAKGQVFESVAVSIKEGKTSPPKRYTEDSLLSAMETAGVEDFPEDAERKGLGTPATRAATIEKLIKAGFVQRQKKNLIPTEKGINLIAVLPNNIKSPLLTAEWEQRLKLVEQGKLSGAEFMEGIYALTRELVAAHSAPVAEFVALFVPTPDPQPKGKEVGKCPRCGGSVVMKIKGSSQSKSKTVNRHPDYFCSTPTCRFALWADNRFFTTKGKKLDKKTANTLLSEGRVFYSDLFSEKTSKTYAAAIVLEDDGARANFKLDFDISKNTKEA
jgi:DNA topoisomerase-3